MSRSAQASLSRLEEIVGGAQIIADGPDIAAREVCGVRPAVVVQPAEPAQIADILRFAAEQRLAVIPTGGCTKLAIGAKPARYDIALDLSRLNRVLAYDPKDLTLGVEPGVRVEDLLRALAKEKQFLPLAVPFADRATIGGVAAANSSSPLRHAYGGARDFCLGMEFVTGEGTPAKSGGRVVKNVTGYDLHKLLIGSLGTLAVITRVNFRTFPLPQTQGTFVATFSSAEAAFDFCREVSHSVLTLQMVEVASPGAAALLFSGEIAARLKPGTWSVVLTAAGSPAVVERHQRDLGHLSGVAKAEEFLPLSDADALPVLIQLREFPMLMMERVPAAAIFRISAAPAAMALLLRKLHVLAAQRDLDFVALGRASGIFYAAFLPKKDPSSAPPTMAGVIGDVFATCSEPELNASAMLEWCLNQLKTSPEVVWGPPRPDFGLMRRVKNSFDPKNVLAPGRFAGGI
ncbi:MAG TPA: FAD-binding oxidoreductase [Verrucomicrobiae bacterium]|jgi:glycolate oxidase FAD binding subunit|nr:FAD-binding oxidoreductase [Verrucomicrobiae bacterium]